MYFYECAYSEISDNVRESDDEILSRTYISYMKEIMPKFISIIKLHDNEMNRRVMSDQLTSLEASLYNLVQCPNEDVVKAHDKFSQDLFPYQRSREILKILYNYKYMIEFLAILILIPILISIFNPPSFQRDAMILSKQKGWKMPIILLTRSFQHFTVYSLLWTFVSLYTLEPDIIFIGMTISWSVFTAYHGINWINPIHLSYHPEELVKIVTYWKPPMSFHIIPWLGLQFQHTVFPFYLLFLSIKHEIYTKLSPWIHTHCFLALLVYIMWHLFCWTVQGMPAYPFLMRLRHNGYEIIFYGIGFIFIFLVNKFLGLIGDKLNMQ